ncbi:MAG: glycosyl transferase family 1, partial [Actinomycetota bacterium]|nr:glycosyl transferase family 1 [Actinomycetota bacterium]
MPRTLIVLCPNAVGERMGGLGIRYTETARALSAGELDVTLAARTIDGSAPDGVRCTTWPADGVRALRRLLAGAHAVFTPPGAPHVMRELRRSGARVVIDLYDPVPLEVLERTCATRRWLRTLHTTAATDQLGDALRSGDFFVCASVRQRDLWIGALLALGLVTPATYARDATLRRLIDIVPFGVSATAPVAAITDPIRSRFPQIAPDDRIILWNGGLWRWLDAPTAIRAVARVRARGLPLRLVFMGASAAGGAGAALAEARAVAAREGLGDAVLFN